MESPFREQPKIQTGSRYRAFASMLFCAVYVVLWVVASKAPQLLENQQLRLHDLKLESFLTSHLRHTNGYHFSLTLIMIFMTGWILETRWGTPRFVAFYLFVAWGTALVTVVAALALNETAPSYGASGVALGSLAAIGLLYPDHKLVRQLPSAKYLAWMLVFLGGAGLAFLDRASLDPQKQTFLLPQVSGVAFALVFLLLDPWCQQLAKRWKAKREEERREKVVAIRHRVDELLEKIHSQGYESLTRDEKMFLRQASKHFKE